MKRWTVRHVPQLFAAALLLIGIVAFNTRPTETFAGSNYLDVPLFGQEQDQWCWAATVQMIMSYHGVSETQCAIVDQILDGCPDETATLNETASALHSYGFDSSTVNLVGAADIVDEINAGRPFWVLWEWKNSKVGHAVVVLGYDSDSSGNATTVYYHDPSPTNEGQSRSLSYDAFVRDERHTWTHTIWNIHQ